jgi:hypothetical protein
MEPTEETTSLELTDRELLDNAAAPGLHVSLGDVEHAKHLLSRIYPHCDREGHAFVTELSELLQLK